MRKSTEEIPKLQPIHNENGSNVNVDTSEFEQIREQLNGIDNTLSDIHKRISDNRAYTDEKVNALKKETDNKFEKILMRLSADIAGAVNVSITPAINQAMMPFVSELATIAERSENNKNDIMDSNKSINSLIINTAAISKQFTDELITRTENDRQVLFTLKGDGGETSGGIVGTLNELKAQKKEQEKTNKLVEKHERIYTFVANINWRFVLITVGILSPSALGILEAFNII